MAMLNEILGTAARFNQLLTRRFSILGGAPSPQITPEVAPMYDVNGDDATAILRGDFLASGCLFQGGVALNGSVCQLRNPVGSNIILLVERITFETVSQSSLVYGSVTAITADLTTGAAAGGVTLRDTRAKSKAGAYTRLPTGRLSHQGQNPPTAIANLFQTNTTAQVPQQYILPVILAPGWALQVVSSLALQSFYVTFAWREIPLAVGEVGPF